MDKQSFVDSSLNIDISVEIGCQYGNLAIINMLRREKKRGKKILLVSDFYLPVSAYQDFLVNIQCQDLFDKCISQNLVIILRLLEACMIMCSQKMGFSQMKW